jgi:hypothetical protein
MVCRRARRPPYPTLTSNSTADLEAIALPDFDDPNIDKDAAIAGVLGTYFLSPGPYLAYTVTQRTTHHIPKSVPPSLTLTIPISLCLRSALGCLAWSGLSLSPYVGQVSEVGYKRSFPLL